MKDMERGSLERTKMLKGEKTQGTEQEEAK